MRNNKKEIAGFGFCEQRVVIVACTKDHEQSSVATAHSRILSFGILYGRVDGDATNNFLLSYPADLVANY